MPELDTLTLSRAQFALTVSFHILFPTLTIGLASFLAVLEGLWLYTKEDVYLRLYRFWSKFFALSFGMGVVSGVVMSFEFGTNFAEFSRVAGNVLGPLLSFEVLTAFFLEATFLGIMLFGFKRVSDRIHTLATVLVAVGTTMSAFWILVLNSWMHTPVGFEIRDGVAHATDWMAIVFNPSMPYRFAHMFVASFLTVAFLLAGLSAYRWLRGDRAPAVLSAMRTGVFMGAALIPVQIVLGDLHGLNTLKYQPAKIAAIEAIWETDRGVPLVLFGFPDEEQRTTHMAVEIPYLASIILKHDPQGELKGLNEFEGEHPPVSPVFWAFRVMVGIGMAMLFVGFWGAWALRKKREPSVWLSRTLVVMAFSGWVAVLAGWYTTEIGRQPWLVQGVLKTADAASAVPGPMIGATLVGYLVLYAFLLTAYISVVFHMARKAGTRKETPQAEGPGVVPFSGPPPGLTPGVQ